MISIRSAISDLEKSDELRVSTLECYVSGIRDVAQYAVELDDDVTGTHRKYLTTLAEDLSDPTLETLTQSRATFRGLLRDYRDKASQFLNRLREELSNTPTALQEIFNALGQSDGDHE